MPREESRDNGSVTSDCAEFCTSDPAQVGRAATTCQRSESGIRICVVGTHDQMIDSENCCDMEQSWKRWPGATAFKARHLAAANPGIAREAFLGEAATGAQVAYGSRNLGTKRALAVAVE